MKLSELRTAIRKMKGNPSVIVELTPGLPMLLILQKTPTLETLGSVYADESGDTGLHLDERGVIVGPTTPALGAAEVFDDEPDLFGADDEDML